MQIPFVMTMFLGAIIDTPAEPSASTSLLRNGGFESIDHKTGTPKYWASSDWSPKDAKGTIRLTSEEEGAAEGKKAARIKYEGKGSNLVVFQDVVRRGVGSYSLRAKCKAFAGAHAYVSIVTFAGNKILQYENSKKVKGDNWQDVDLTIMTVPETERIRIILRANGEAAPDGGVVPSKKASPVTADQQADLDRKAKMSPDELSWEKILEQNLGGFYLPLYKKAKAKGRTTAWDYVKDDHALPRVLLIGDSISRGYTVPTRKLLKGKVNLHRAPANCGPTSQGLKKLDVWLGSGKWDLVQFNFGIHDRNSKAEDYAARLEKIVARLEQTGAKLIWASSTPLPENAERYKGGDCRRLNAAAAVVMKKHGVPTNDLFNAVQPHLGKYQNPGDCHFNGKGYEFLGQRVADKILIELDR